MRVVALAADALGRMSPEHLPAALKRVSSFAPGRRAKLAGTQIVTVLETDEDFRDRLATQVRALVPELAAALDAGTTPAAVDPVEVAAVAYLIRPPGWSTTVDEAAAAVAEERRAESTQQSVEQATRLRRQVETATEELKQARQRHREEVARLKADNADLRHKLGDARAKARAAESTAEEADRKVAEAQRLGLVAGTQNEAEIRRLRARVEELEAEVGAARRAERLERGTGTLRTRLLLDTLLDTAQGLQAGARATDLGRARPRTLSRRTWPSRARAPPPATVRWQATTRRCSTRCWRFRAPTWSSTATTSPRRPGPSSRWRNSGTGCSAGSHPLVARSGAEVTVVFDAARRRSGPW